MDFGAQCSHCHLQTAVSVFFYQGFQRRVVHQWVLCLQVDLFMQFSWLMSSFLRSGSTLICVMKILGPISQLTPLQCQTHWTEWTLRQTKSTNRSHKCYFTFSSITAETNEQKTPPISSQIFSFKVFSLQQKYFWKGCKAQGDIWVPSSGSAAWLEGANRFFLQFLEMRLFPRSLCPALPLILFPCRSLGHRILGWVRALSFPYHVSAVSNTTVTQTIRAPVPCSFYLLHYEAEEASLRVLLWWRQDRHQQKDWDQLSSGWTERGRSGTQKLVVLHGAGDACLRTSKGYGKPVCGPKQKGNPDHFLSLNAVRAGVKGESS